MIVYSITHRATGEQYIGRTVRALRVRILEHLRDARNRPQTQGRLGEDLLTFGLEAFECAVIYECESLEENIECERALIARFSPSYNRPTYGPGGLPEVGTAVRRPRSRHQRRKIAQGLRGAWQSGLRKVAL